MFLVTERVDYGESVKFNATSTWLPSPLPHFPPKVSLTYWSLPCELGRHDGATGGLGDATTWGHSPVSWADTMVP